MAKNLGYSGGSCLQPRWVMLFGPSWWLFCWVLFFCWRLKQQEVKLSSKKFPSCLGDRQERVEGLCIPQCWQEIFLFVKNCQVCTKWKSVSLIFLCSKQLKPGKKTLVEHPEHHPVPKIIEIPQKT